MNLCLNCIEKGWYDPETHICSFNACDECPHDPNSCDNVCNPPECTHGYDAYPHTWNPEVRIEIYGDKIVKLADLHKEAHERQRQRQRQRHIKAYYDSEANRISKLSNDKDNKEIQ